MNKTDLHKELTYIIQEGYDSLLIFRDVKTQLRETQNIPLFSIVHGAFVTNIQGACVSNSILHINYFYKNGKMQISFPNLLHKLEALYGTTKAARIKRCKKLLASVAQPVGYAGDLRGKYFGHRELSNFNKNILEDTKLTLDSLEKCYKTAVALLRLTASLSENNEVSFKFHESSINSSVSRFFDVVNDDFATIEKSLN